jgi:hypothetical protein
MAQLVVHRSANVRRAAPRIVPDLIGAQSPTARQLVVAVQLTPSNHALRVSGGFGVVFVDHAVPFQWAAMVRIGAGPLVGR